VLDVIT